MRNKISNKAWYKTRKIDKGITRALAKGNCLKWEDLIDLQDEFKTYGDSRQD